MKIDRNNLLDNLLWFVTIFLENSPSKLRLGLKFLIFIQLFSNVKIIIHKQKQESLIKQFIIVYYSVF